MKKMLQIKSLLFIIMISFSFNQSTWIAGTVGMYENPDCSGELQVFPSEFYSCMFQFTLNEDGTGTQSNCDSTTVSVNSYLTWAIGDTGSLYIADSVCEGDDGCNEFMTEEECPESCYWDVEEIVMEETGDGNYSTLYLEEEGCENENFQTVEDCEANGHDWHNASCMYFEITEGVLDCMNCDEMDEDCFSDDDCEDWEICEDGECVDNEDVGDENCFCDDGMGGSIDDAQNQEDCDLAGGTWECSEGAPDCIYDCPDFALVDGDTELSSNEACTIISGWNGDACLDDCDESALEGINPFIDMCTECLANDNCDEMFDGGCEENDECSDGQICYDGDCIGDPGCSDCMDYCTTYVMDNYGYTYDEAFDWCFTTSEAGNGCWDSCANDSDNMSGPPECALDCIGVEDVDPDDIVAFCEWALALDGSCFEDCEGEDAIEINEMLTACENLEIEIALPIQHTLLTPYPNPFNPATTISFELTKPDFVKIDIYDINGRIVESLVDEMRYAGIHNVVWNATNYPSGIYFVKMNSSNYYATEKVILIK